MFGLEANAGSPRRSWRVEFALLGEGCHIHSYSSAKTSSIKPADKLALDCYIVNCLCKIDSQIKTVDRGETPAMFLQPFAFSWGAISSIGT